MNTALKWIITVVGWLVLLIIYGVWKDIEKHTGGGFITGLLRGAFVFGGAYYLYKWAKNDNPKIKQVKIENDELSPVSVTPAFPNAIPPEATAKVQLVPSTLTVVGHAAMPIAPSQSASSLNTVDEDRVYDLIAKELEVGRPQKGLWTRLFAECGGDEKETRVLYIKQRAQRLIAGEQARLEQLAHEQAVEAEKAEKLRLEAKELSDLRISELSKTNSAVNLLNRVRLNNAEDVLALLNQEPLLVAVTNSEGDTALHIALREKYPSMVQLLLEKGAPVEVSNAYGVTPIELAKKSNRPELIRLLSAVA